MQPTILPTKSSVSADVTFKPFVPPAFDRSIFFKPAAGDPASDRTASHVQGIDALGSEEVSATEEEDFCNSDDSAISPAPIIFEDGMQGIECANGKLYKAPLKNGKPDLASQWIEMTQHESDWYVEQKPIIDADELDRQNGISRREPKWKPARRYVLRKPATMNKSGLSENMRAAITAAERASKRERSEGRKLAKREGRLEDTHYALNPVAARETTDVLTRQSKRRKTEIEGRGGVKP